MTELGGQRGGDLGELRILKGERGGGFWPDKEIGHFHRRSETDTRDLVEIGGVHLKPVRWIGFDFGEIELSGAGEMMGLVLWDQAGNRE